MTDTLSIQNKVKRFAIRCENGGGMIFRTAETVEGALKAALKPGALNEHHQARGTRIFVYATSRTGTPRVSTFDFVRQTTLIAVEVS